MVSNPDLHVVKTFPDPTRLEVEWDKPSGHIFKSDWHGVMAVASEYPKMPFEVVVAPAHGRPGEEVSFYDLDLKMQRKVSEVGLFVGSKILEYCQPDQRSMFTLEGFGIPDHAHIVYYAGKRHEGRNRYDGKTLGAEAVARTLDLITLTPAENDLLVSRLDQIDDI